MVATDLVGAFLAALSPAVREEVQALPDLAERLEALFADARTVWPAIQLPDEDFAAYLAARQPTAVLIEAARAADLFVACACTRGDEAAIDGFQRRFFGEIDAAGRRARAGDDIIAEARQNLARSLFTGAPPAVAGYSGRGDLRGWIRVTGIREVLRLLERARREIPIGVDVFLDALSPADDPELAFLKQRYRDEFVEALREAVASLSDRERLLFRRQLIDGWGIDELAAEFGIHRSTAARWLTAARRTVLEQTRALLKERWGATTLEVDSIVRLLGSRLDVSLETAVRTR